MKFQIPIGPQHPALKEPISLRMTVEGEVIRTPTSGSATTTAAWRSWPRRRTWIQNIYLTERICGICSHSHTTCYVQGVEKLMEIEPPRRGVYLRYLVSELERVHSHLLWLGVAGHEAGFDSFFMYTWRDREVVMDLLEMISGNRVHYAINTLGGVRRDLDEAQIRKILDGLKVLRERSEYLLQDRGHRADLRRPAGRRRQPDQGAGHGPLRRRPDGPGLGRRPRRPQGRPPRLLRRGRPSTSPRPTPATSSAGPSSGSRS